MTKAELWRYRAALQAKKNEIGRRLHSGMESLHVDEGGDRMDEIRGMIERNATADEVVRMSRLLELVEDACERVDRGTFGVCVACGEKLPRKRLELLPWAPYCVNCQDLSERAEQEFAGPPRRVPERLAS
jgi:DnaK suppressor protein